MSEEEFRTVTMGLPSGSGTKHAPAYRDRPKAPRQPVKTATNHDFSVRPTAPSGHSKSGLGGDLRNLSPRNARDVRNSMRSTMPTKLRNRTGSLSSTATGVSSTATGFSGVDASEVLPDVEIYGGDHTKERPGSNPGEMNLGSDMLRVKSMSVGPTAQHFQKNDISATRRKLAESSSKSKSAKG